MPPWPFLLGIGVVLVLFTVSSRYPWMQLGMLGALFLTAGLWCIVGSSLDWRRGIASERWPTVQGTITQSAVVWTSGDRNQRGSYSPEVHYRYEVDGKPYLGQRIRFGGPGHGRAAADDFVRRHPVGSSVTVFYDPTSFDRSVLVAGINPLLPIVPGLGLVFAALGGFLLTCALRKVRSVSDTPSA